MIPALARADFPAVPLDEPAQVRSPATLDRAATLRWLFGALACLGIFWAVSHFADRLERLYLVWGCVLAAFLLNGAFGFVQISGQVEGLYGYLRPGAAPIWAPSVSDLLDSPTSTSLRRVNDLSRAATGAALQPAAVVPEQPVLMGTMMGGYGAFLAFGSLALPLGLAIVLHMLSPRGSRESLLSRLSHKGQGSLIVLLLLLLVSSAFLVGMLTGPRFCVPFVVGLVVVGLPSARRIARLVARFDGAALDVHRARRGPGRCVADCRGRLAPGRGGLMGCGPAHLEREPDDLLVTFRLWARAWEASARSIPTSRRTTHPRPRP